VLAEFIVNSLRCVRFPGLFSGWYEK